MSVFNCHVGFEEKAEARLFDALVVTVNVCQGIVGVDGQALGPITDYVAL